jgi:glucose/arabinose dehydrogenase
MKLLGASLFALLVLLLCRTLLSATELGPGFQEDLLVYGLRFPVAAEYAPDGRLFILEKGGNVRIFKNGELLTRPFLKVKVNDIFERGLLGLAFDPEFASNGYLYLYRSTVARNPKNRVERYTAAGDIAIAGSRRVLVAGINSDTGQHNAGCIRFGPDGKLYVSTGDGGMNPALSQDLSSLNGKILRVNPDGTAPADNPFIDQPGARPEIWCYGLRNPWRYAFHASSGLMAIGDVGGAGFEEINIGSAGQNFGWPLAEGPSDNPLLTNPVYSYSHQEASRDAAIVAGLFYTANQFPATYGNRLFFTDYVRGFIKTLELDATGRVLRVEDFATSLETPVHMLQAPDGSILYVSIRAGEIRKIRYVGGRNRPPVVSARASTDGGAEPLRVQFRSTGSFDPDGDPISFFWDFGDRQTSTAADPVHTYTGRGSFFAILTVRDNRGASARSLSLRIVVGNELPVAEILAPSGGSGVHPGETVSFSGRGTDREDGQISPRFLLWSAELHHNHHTHPFLDELRGAYGSFTSPAELHGGGTLFYRLQLRVVDSADLSGYDYVDIQLLP